MACGVGDSLDEATWISDCNRVTLYRGDCLDILPSLKPGSIDAVVTDPPYGISVKGSNYIGLAGKGTRKLDFLEGDDDWLQMRTLALESARGCMGLLGEFGSMYWWCGHRQVSHLAELFESNGFKTKLLAWVKACPAPPPPNSGWGTAFEICLYAFKSGRTWNKPASSNHITNNIITADSYRFGQPGKVDHPTQKPTLVIEPCVTSCTNEHDCVLDPFMGSGTTGKVCVRTNRQFVGIEKNLEYFDIAKRRISEELEANLFIQNTRNE